MRVQGREYVAGKIFVQFRSLLAMERSEFGDSPDVGSFVLPLESVD